MKTEAEKLNNILSLNPELQALYETNGRVHAYCRCVFEGTATVQEMLIGLVVDQAQSNTTLMNEIVDIKSKQVKMP